MLDLTPLCTKDYFEMPENVRHKYFLNWHRYVCQRIDKVIAAADAKLGYSLGGPPMRKRKRSNGRVKRGAHL